MLDVDGAFPTDRAVKAQCDFILFYVDAERACLVIVPMELKRGDVDASDAIKQLQEGAHCRSLGAKECQNDLYPSPCLWKQENS